MKELEQRLYLENLTSPRVVKEILAAHHLRLKKRLGQNFLVDRNVLNKILESAELKSKDLVIEIGTGLGCLTREIAFRVARVWTIEIDRGLVKILKEKLKAFSNTEIIHGDALKIKFSRLIFKEYGKCSPGLTKRIKIIGNIPYSLTTPLIIKILEEEPSFKTVWLVLPEDVVKRIKAHPGTKAYGAFSLLVRFYAELRVIRKISPHSFFPVPKISSILVKLERHENIAFQAKHQELFFELVKAAFRERRKKLSNALKPLLKEKKLDSGKVKGNTEIDLNRRGESLTFEEFVILSDNIAKITRES